MARYTDNPLNDAVDEMVRQDSIEYVYDNKCVCCNEGFDEGHGVQISDEKFCNPCIDEFKHYEFYRSECGLSDNQIYEVTNQQKPI